MEHAPTIDLTLTRARVMDATRDLDGSTVRDLLLDCLLVRGVDATVTEFRGANFVLVTRSVLVARPRGTGTTP